ncbi:MAG: hypothetical protein U0326_17190 [Polyangiales bacterium]
MQEVVMQLQRKPLPSSPEHPRTYFGRALQNRALSALRRKSPELAAEVPEPPPELDTPSQERQTAAREVLDALQSLTVEDRVALKLASAPEALDDGELDWLAARLNVSRYEARSLALTRERTEDLARLFEGEHDATETRVALRAIDRFHKRISRARQRLRDRIGG